MEIEEKINQLKENIDNNINNKRKEIDKSLNMENKLLTEKNFYLQQLHEEIEKFIKFKNIKKELKKQNIKNASILGSASAITLTLLFFDKILFSLAAVGVFGLISKKGIKKSKKLKEQYKPYDKNYNLGTISYTKNILNDIQKKSTIQEGYTKELEQKYNELKLQKSDINYLLKPVNELNNEELEKDNDSKIKRK